MTNDFVFQKRCKEADAGIIYDALETFLFGQDVVRDHFAVNVLEKFEFCKQCWNESIFKGNTIQNITYLLEVEGNTRKSLQTT